MNQKSDIGSAIFFLAILCALGSGLIAGWFYNVAVGGAIGIGLISFVISGIVISLLYQYTKEHE